MMDTTTLQKIAILIVNQDKMVLDKIKSLVNSFGIEKVVCVGTYEEAFDIACLKKNSFDLVISNICLGENSGYSGVDICRRIKIEDPRTLCLITAEEYSDTDMIELLSCNIDGIIDRQNMIRIMTKWISILAKKKLLQGLIHSESDR